MRRLPPAATMMALSMLNRYIVKKVTRLKRDQSVR
jgi:hypothetical protein